MIEWPQKYESSGKFRTTPTNVAVFTNALEAVLREHSPNRKLQTRILTCLGKLKSSEKNWRNDYVSVLHEIGVITSLLEPAQAIVLAEAGLQALQESMVFRPPGNATAMTAYEYFATEIHSSPKWDTLTFKGANNNSKLETFGIPSPQDSRILLRGDDAVSQVQAWVEYGCMESSAGLHAMTTLQANQKSLEELLNDKLFVLLGVTSSIGPAKPLLSLAGSHVLGISRQGKNLQQLLNWFQKGGNSNATLQVPTHGADILKDGPAIAKWIIDQIPLSKRKHVILCNLAYMDGEAHVRASVAMDLICSQVTKHCDQHQVRVSLSYLTSQYTVLAIPPAAAADAAQRYQTRPFWQSAIPYCLSTWNFGQSRPVLNGLGRVQGPNYALAKTMQQWRAMVTAWKSDRIVSAPCAPVSRSKNVVGQSAALAAYVEGMQHLTPLLAFNVPTSRSLMASILLSQVSSSNKAKSLEHPMHVIWDGCVHSGLWRCPYQPDRAALLACLLGRLCTPSHWVPKESLANHWNQKVGESGRFSFDRYARILLCVVLLALIWCIKNLSCVSKEPVLMG